MAAEVLDELARLTGSSEMSILELRQIGDELYASAQRRRASHIGTADMFEYYRVDRKNRRQGDISGAGRTP